MAAQPSPAAYAQQALQLLPLLSAALLASPHKVRRVTCDPQLLTPPYHHHHHHQDTLLSAPGFVDSVVGLVRHLLAAAADQPAMAIAAALLKRLLDCFLFNSFLWASLVHTTRPAGAAHALHSLYAFVAADLLRLAGVTASGQQAQQVLLFGSEVRRVSTVLQVLHAL